MIINDKNNFTSIVMRLLSGLGYENVATCEKENIDITATKDGEKYCLKCKYDIDAIGEKSINDFAKAAKAGNYSKMIFVTNSSFLSAAKKRADEENIILWDRNTMDRLYIGVSDSIEDKAVPKKKHKSLFVVIALVLVILGVVGFESWYFFFR